MVGAMIRMNMAMQRNTLSGARVLWAIIGFALAVGTLALSLVGVADPAISVDLLAAAFAAWTVILALAPVFGGGGGGIRPEHFALLPISPRRLATGLLGAAMVGMAPAVALVAFAALPMHGFRLGVVPGLAGTVALLLQLVLVVLLARVVYGLMGAAMQTRLGMELVAVLFALFLALVSVGWFVLEPVFGQIDRVLAEGWPPAVSILFRVLPSGWGLVAVDAAARADWAVAAGASLGLMALIGGLLLGWASLLGRGTASRPASYYSRYSSPLGAAALHRRLSSTRVGAVVSRELYAWTRDPWRALELRIALWTGLLIGVIPLMIGWVEFLPYVGVIIVIMGGAVSGNLYALDGSALWQTLLTPGAERVDVRGRQWAWLLIFAPVSLAATVVFTMLSGQDWVWPLVLSVLPAVLGGAAGLVPLFSVRFPSPGIDPQLRRNPMDSSGDTLAEIFIMPVLIAVIAAPAAGIVGAGLMMDDPVLQWAGVPVGACTGVLFAWWLGRSAYLRLEARGPELLSLLLKGRAGPAKSGEESPSEKAWRALPLREKVIVWICGGLFWVPLSLQGIIPIVMKLNGSEERSWFLAFYLPAAFHWPAIIAMIALGLAMLAIAIQLPRMRSQQQQD